MEVGGQKFQGKLFLIVGPSGSGKGSVIKKIRSHYPGFVYPISYTTRAPREDEMDGEVYHFISREDFQKKMLNDELLEYAVVHSDNYYGSVKSEILEPLKNGAVIIREVDIQGFRSIKGKIPAENLVSIFMEVNDLADLEKRISQRGEISADELRRRMQSAVEEISHKNECDFKVKNVWGKMGEAVSTVEKIVLKEIKDLY